MLGKWKNVENSGEVIKYLLTLASLFRTFTPWSNICKATNL